MSTNNTLRLGEMGKNHLSTVPTIQRKQALQVLAKAKEQERKKKGKYQYIDSKTRVFVEEK